ncbi:MAG: DUF3021 family protein [Mobilitalea sp.]
MVVNMNFVDFLKRNLIIYFIIVTGITVAIAVLGTIYDSGTLFGYQVFYSPIILGAVAVIPSFVLFSKRELTFKQMLLRRILHFILLEIMLLVFGALTGILSGIEVALSYAFSIFAVYLFTSLVQWISDSKTANAINKGLKRILD